MFGSKPAASFEVQDRRGNPGRVPARAGGEGRCDRDHPDRDECHLSGGQLQVRRRGTVRSAAAVAAIVDDGRRRASAAGGALGSTQTAGAACRVSLRSKRVVVALRTGAAIRLLRTGSGQCRGTVTLRYKQRITGKRFQAAEHRQRALLDRPGQEPGGEDQAEPSWVAKLFLAGHGKLNASLAVLRTTPGAEAGENGERAPEREENAQAGHDRPLASPASSRRETALHYCRGPMARIPINIAELVGDTPLVELPRMLDGTPAADSGVRAVRQARVVQPGRQRQGPHRRGDDRGGRGRRADRARAHDDRRGDERQHGDRAGVRVRGQGL